MNKNRYSSKDLALIIPTKDRPEKVNTLLKSIELQNVSCGRIIFVDGGESVRQIVMNFSDRLPVEHYECKPPGQIRQRNMGLSMLNHETPLVGLLDDDIVLEKESIENILDFWNQCEPETAGVSFNIINIPSEKCSFIKSALLLGSSQPGKVLRSGMTSSNCNVPRDFKVQWLCGGATIWRKEILDSYINREVFTRWAIAEDLIFSYPISKKYPLYVCADAKVRHEHVYDYVSTMQNRFHARTRTIWTYYFVESNKELSRTIFLSILLIKIMGRVLVGSIRCRTEDLEFAFGEIEGAVKIVRCLIRGQSVETRLSE